MLRRPRRNRRSAAIRGMIRETHLSTDHLVYPLFIFDGKNIKDEISSLPGNFRMSLDNILIEIEECVNLGLCNFMIFPAVAEKLKNKTATDKNQKEISRNNFD